MTNNTSHLVFLSDNTPDVSRLVTKPVRQGRQAQEQVCSEEGTEQGLGRRGGGERTITTMKWAKEYVERREDLRAACSRAVSKSRVHTTCILCSLIHSTSQLQFIIIIDLIQFPLKDENMST